MFLLLVPWLVASLGETWEALVGGQKGIRGKFLKATVKFLVPKSITMEILVLLLTQTEPLFHASATMMKL